MGPHYNGHNVQMYQIRGGVKPYENLAILDSFLLIRLDIILMVSLKIGI